MLHSLRLRVARWLGIKPKTGLRSEFKRAYMREYRGAWWMWRRWSKKAARVYRERRIAEAFDRPSMGYYPDPAVITFHPTSEDQGGSP